MFENLPGQLYQAVIANDRWMVYLRGLGITLATAAGAVLLGVIIGILVAIIKVNVAQADKNRQNAITRFLYKLVNGICDIYLTVIRGTPLVVQLLIFYNIIFVGFANNLTIIVAIIAFGLNSGAYVAEIIRAGILAVDVGQMEAGRSLGLTRGMTIKSIIMPQAIKNILPALGNEFIVLVKETSIVGYIAMEDLTKAATMIQSRTYQALVPLLLAALIYLILVMFMTWGLRKLERRLNRNDNR